MSAPTTCPCGNDEHRTDLDDTKGYCSIPGEAPSCMRCEHFACAGCGRWVPWDDGCDDEHADLCDECWAAPFLTADATDPAGAA